MEEYLRLTAGLLGTCVLAALALFAVRGAWDMYGKLREASASSVAAGRELASLETQEARMNADIARLSSARGVEGEMRERYGFARPGEGVIHVVDRAPATVGAGPRGGGGSAVLKALFSW